MLDIATRRYNPGIFQSIVRYCALWLRLDPWGITDIPLELDVGRWNGCQTIHVAIEEGKRNDGMQRPYLRHV